MKYIILFWFKVQSQRAAYKVLHDRFSKQEIQDILAKYWILYKKRKATLPQAPSLGGVITTNLAAMSLAFHEVLVSHNLRMDEATEHLFDICWIVYEKMGRYVWNVTGLISRNNHKRLLRSTQMFKSFPFNQPSYEWKDIDGIPSVVAFDNFKCPVAEYFKMQGKSDICFNTWCKLDFKLAELWNARLERFHTIADGSEKCDFRWMSVNEQIHNK
jgi:ubiquinone biosynthesis protein